MGITVVMKELWGGHMTRAAKGALGGATNGSLHGHGVSHTVGFRPLALVAALLPVPIWTSGEVLRCGFSSLEATPPHIIIS